jgi:F0F1-type ATP synthase membrane subunit b/b'
MLIQLFIIQAITFIGLIFVLRLLFYRQLNVALNRLKRLHEENVAKEEKLNKQIEQSRFERETELSRAKKIAEDMVKSAKEKAEKIALDIHAQAQEQAKKMAEMSKVEQERLKSELLADFEKRAMELAVLMIKTTFTIEGVEVLQHQLISEVIEELKNMDKEKFTVKSSTADIFSVFPLNDVERKDLGRILSEKVETDVEINEFQNPEIIAGLIIQVGALTVDGSLSNRLKRIIPYVKGR